jgi:cell division protein FtsB
MAKQEEAISLQSLKETIDNLEYDLDELKSKVDDLEGEIKELKSSIPADPKAYLDEIFSRLNELEARR